MANLIPAQKRHYPHIMLPDALWDRVVKALRERGTKQDAAMADQIEMEVQAMRQNRLDLDARRERRAQGEPG